MSSAAWSIGKTDRCKFNAIFNFLVKIDAFQKKNKEMAGVSPVSYDKTLVDKKKDPAFSMGGRIEDIDKRVIVSPQKYNLPSKMSSAGKSMGIKLDSGLVPKQNNFPGPG